MNFVKSKYDKLDGTTAIRQTLEGSDFYIEAGPRGVVIKGEVLIEDRADLQPLAKAIGDAWTDHRRLVPKLVSNIAGH